MSQRESDGSCDKTGRDHQRLRSRPFRLEPVPPAPIDVHLRAAKVAEDDNQLIVEPTAERLSFDHNPPHSLGH